MAGRTTAPRAKTSDDEAPAVNEVRLVGRWQGGDERELPSGDVVVTGRVVVPRVDGGVDTVDCALWKPHLRKRALGWPPATVVEVTGSLRRRFWRTPSGPSSRYEVEVLTARTARAAR
ncbi:hypothetical protein GCM10027446_19840 [Angustibacter peucedani]